MQKKETRPKYIEAIIVTIPLHANPINALFNVQLKFSTTDIREGLIVQTSYWLQSFNLNFQLWNFIMRTQLELSDNNNLVAWTLVECNFW